ncbi:glutathionylspermidine synthase family protein [Alkaliphilus peptidifermentans]|uniref:Glutathionylspermidine synthase n=1 Tax=Alkaliphilus peptidifermentans DSM 18978 TaxID=1120976 RepID=A0A1G5FNB6_9FIRM|nr:glutathionylspermidine synthase family protein [Alkaliphilus peptidifermentans]SCY40310.1 Glutathionylspermidine synthase [Alkaliphilus peptidifermentans DSM 18978]
METEKLFKVYKENLLQNKQEFIEEYKTVEKAVEESPARYKGKPVEFLYQPMFLSSKDMNMFDNLTQQLMTILNKVIQHYLHNEDFRTHFGFSSLLEKMILKDPGYDCNTPMGRFDIFYHYNGSFQFCELNADGSSGMSEQQELQKIFSSSKALNQYSSHYEYKGFELFQSWVDALLANYKKYSKANEKPNVAIMDWIEGEPPSEFIEFKKYFEANGCTTVIVDPRWLEYKNGKLYYKDLPIDCIYRRAVTWEIIERAEEVQDFINAYLAGDICVIGPLRSQIIHNKNIFAILHDKDKTPFLSDDERGFINKHIPFTIVFNNNDNEMVKYTLENKNKLVLKPMDKYASRGVRIGRDYNDHEWMKIIKDEAVEDYLLQEFCMVPKISMAKFTYDDIEFFDYNYIIGLFMYNGKLQGVYTRVGTKNIIGSIVECYTVPNFILEKK